MTTRVFRCLRRVCAAFVLVTPAFAQRAAPTAVAQFAYGAHFQDPVYELNTVSGRMSTILLDATVPSRIGENTFFVRFFSGAFVDGQGTSLRQRTRAYGEWTSRFSLVGRARRESAQVTLRDVFVAAQLNRSGTGFQAQMAGVGVKLRTPGGLLTTNTVYYRKSVGDVDALKARTSWYLPARVGAARLTFDGSVDYVSASSTGPDVSVMPSMVLDVSPLMRAPRGTLAIGTEWFIHRTRGARMTAPQLIARWRF